MAAILTLPFDVAKTQRQVALGAVEAVRGEAFGWCGVGARGGPSRVLLGRALCLQCRPHALTPPGCCCGGSGLSLAPGDFSQVSEHPCACPGPGGVGPSGSPPLTPALPSRCRLPPEDHQGRPVLCHHDQHLRAGQKLLSEAQPGAASGPVRGARVWGPVSCTDGRTGWGGRRLSQVPCPQVRGLIFLPSQL